MFFRKQLFSLSLLLTAWSGVVRGQSTSLSPLPQEITWGDEAFLNSVSYNIVGAESADPDAVAQLRKALSTSTTGSVNITIGEVDDAVATPFVDLVPTQSEGYYLKVSPTEVIIIGRDEAGTFYGVKTFLQMAQSPKVMQCEVKDFPNVSPRGVVEGYYGNPWSQTDRIRQFEFYGDNKLNTYIYGPKDDPYHKQFWRENYPTEQANKLKELVEAAKHNKVRFVWAIHPGSSIKWTDADGDGVVDDFKNCLRKLLAMYDLGIREFAVFFDDISGEGTNPVNQAKMMNYLTEQLHAIHPDVKPLIICPTQYNRGWASGNYLTTLGTQMNKEVNIMWTGNSVVDMINYGDMEWINQQISRKAYIWLNYPVTDYCVDHLLMGPTYGNDLNIAPMLSGFTANPMEYAEASKVSLFSIADYTWNMARYDAQRSWQNALTYLWPSQRKAFKVFCENNIDLGNTGHGLRRAGESPAFAPIIQEYKRTGQWTPDLLSRFELQLDSLVWAANTLLADQSQPEMLAELTPWLKVMRLVAQRGKAVVAMQRLLQAQTLNSEEFIRQYQLYGEYWKEQKSIISRGFEGSIKSPNPVVANEVLAPFIALLKGQSETEYRRRSTYRLDLLPQLVLPEGKYYIKFQGKYLTNRMGSSYPTWESTLDNINPARQEWNVTLDAETGRYKIVSAQDSKYINELGNFGTNEYLSVWNSYYISRYQDKFAIRNAGSGGVNYWVPNSTRINAAQGGASVWSYDLYQFEFVPIGSELSPSVFQLNTPYYISNNGLYLTASDAKMQPLTFKDMGSVTDSRKQQWVFTLDANTKRIKMINVYNRWYVNERGVFGENAYYSSWNSYGITECGNAINIQNAGDGGTDLWTVGGNGVLTTGKVEWNSSFVFTITPVTSTAVHSLQVSPTSDVVYYAIDGVASNHPVSGINIVGNKKVLLKR